jgi:hypothetical protein
MVLRDELIVVLDCYLSSYSQSWPGYNDTQVSTPPPPYPPVQNRREDTVLSGLNTVRSWCSTRRCTRTW